MPNMSPAIEEIIAYERMANDSQYAWAISGWMNSKKPYWEYYNKDNENFYKVYRPYIIKRLEECPPLIAVLKEDPFVYLGFVCGQGGKLYYAYTKGDWRRNGIANKLMHEECGDSPGVYYDKTFKKKFFTALERKGWRYEEKKQ